jgi:hypothetical protein
MKSSGNGIYFFLRLVLKILFLSPTVPQDQNRALLAGRLAHKFFVELQ